MFARRIKHGGDVWDKPAGILDFSSNTNPLGPPPLVLNALRKGLSLIERYPDPEHVSLRRALASHMGLTPEEVVVGCGSTELIYLVAELCFAVHRRPPRGLVAAPSFGEYEVAVKRLGGRVRFVFANPEDFRFDMGEIVSNTPSEGIVYLCNPNNPTAQSLRDREVEEVAAECERRGTILVVDEGFVEFSAKPEETSVMRLVGCYEGLVVLRSPGKLYAIPGLRVGYAGASKRLASRMRALQQPWSVGVLGELGLTAALEDQEYVRRSREYVFCERERFSSLLSRLGGLRVHPSDTNFLFVDVGGTGLGSTLLRRRLLERGFLIRDCSDFRGLGDRYVRLAVRTRWEDDRLVGALRGVLAGAA